jgi:hypothetical protein
MDTNPKKLDADDTASTSPRESAYQLVFVLCSADMTPRVRPGYSSQYSAINFVAQAG